jgi:hypothetical protein
VKSSRPFSISIGIVTCGAKLIGSASGSLVSPTFMQMPLFGEWWSSAGIIPHWR